MATALTRDTLSHARLCDINGEDYNPRDNRTFRDKPLSLSPYEDIKLRIALEKLEKGERGFSVARTCYGNILIPTMTANIGESNVLQFPQAKEFSHSVKIKTIKETTLLPPSLVRRYQQEKRPTYCQSVPIYFNTKRERFFSPLDCRFGEELAVSEYDVLISDTIKCDRKQFYFEAETLSELIKQVKGLRSDENLLSRYRNYFVDFEQAERVIVLHFNRTLNEYTQGQAILRDNHYNPLIERQSATWSYYQAAKVGDTLYLMDSEGNIDKQNTLGYNPDHFVSSLEPVEKTLGSSLLLDRRNVASLIMPYSEASWEIVTSLHARLNALFDEIQQVLLSAKQAPDTLDKPLSDVRLDYALTDKRKGTSS